MMSFLIFLCLSLNVFAGPREFGFEFTFNNELINKQTTSPTQMASPEAVRARIAWLKLAKAYCLNGACQVIETTVKRQPAFKILFADEFWIEVSHDPNVLEVTMQKGSQEHYLRHEKVIEDLVFQAAASVNLTPHERIGGGHISYDYETIFAGNPLLLRNFIADRANHPELAFGIFGNHLGNAPPIAALKRESKEKFYEIIKDFDNGKISNADLLLSKIVLEVYNNNPYDWSPGAYAHYQDLNFQNATSQTPKNKRRVEVRGHRPQTSFAHAMQEIALAEANLNYLESLNQPILVDIPKTANLNIGDKVFRFSQWLQARGLSLDDYRDMMLPEAAAAKPLPGLRPLNEVESEVSGKNASYEAVSAIYQDMTAEDEKKFIENSKKIGSDKRYLIPYPKILTQSQALTLRIGAEQRARALKAFYDDILSGEKKYATNQVIPDDVLKRIMVKAEISDVSALLDNKRPNIGFYYAPDVVMDGNGEFRVLEDNTGYAGGMGDSLQSRIDLLKLAPDYAAVLSANGDGFAKAIADTLKANSNPKNGELVFIIPDDQVPYNKYFIQQLEKNGVHAITPEKFNGKSITVRDGIPYIQLKINGTVQLKKIGASMIRNFSYAGFKQEFPRTLEAMLKGTLPVIGLPLGRFGILSDKETAAYVENMIRFYLHEEPILKTAKTFSFRSIGPNNTTILNKDILEHVFKNLPHYVVKETQGLQGSEVWIGGSMSEETRQSLYEMIQKNPGAYIAQEYIPVSRIQKWITDIRIHVAVLGDTIKVADVFWGRALSVFDNGKLNTHQNAGVVGIFTEGRDLAPGNIVQLLSNLKKNLWNEKTQVQLKDLQGSGDEVAQILATKMISQNMDSYVDQMRSPQDVESLIAIWPFNILASQVIESYLKRFSDGVGWIKNVDYILNSDKIPTEFRDLLKVNLDQQIKKFDFRDRDLEDMRRSLKNKEIALALLELDLTRNNHADTFLSAIENTNILSAQEKFNLARMYYGHFLAMNPTMGEKERYIKLYSNPLLKQKWFGRNGSVIKTESTVMVPLRCSMTYLN